MTKPTTVAALFVQRDGVYWNLEGCDPWDEQRDARLYAGPHPVVCHSPCSRWCRLAGLVEARYGHRKGDDGGCFGSALDSVRRWGGVLEHPAHTDAWIAFDLPAPPAAGWLRTFCGGWVCSVEQGNYGHRARKATWLYAHGMVPPPMRWGRSVARAYVSWQDLESYPDMPRLGKKEAASSPPEFRDALISIARLARDSGATP